MYGRKVKFRLLFLLSILLTISLTIFLFFKTFEKDIVYFKSPSDIKELSQVEKKKN